MRPLPRISDAEWEVMKILWDKAPATANDVVEIVKHLEGHAIAVCVDGELKPVLRPAET